jgi:flagellar basal body-associated protein FliL
LDEWLFNKEDFMSLDPVAMAQVMDAIEGALEGIIASVPNPENLSEADRRAITNSIDEAALRVVDISLGLSCEDEVLAEMSEERNPYLRPLLEVARQAMSSTSVHGQ